MEVADKQENSGEATPEQEQQRPQLRQDPHQVRVGHGRVRELDGIGDRRERRGRDTPDRGEDHPGTEDEVRERARVSLGSAENAPQARDEPQKRESAEHPQVGADDVARVVSAVGEVTRRSPERRRRPSGHRVTKDAPASMSTTKTMPLSAAQRCLNMIHSFVHET